MHSKTETETMQEDQLSRAEVAKRDVNVEVMLETNMGTSGYPTTHLIEAPKKDYDSGHVVLPSLAASVGCEHNEVVDLDSAAADMRRVRIMDTTCVAVVFLVRCFQSPATPVQISGLPPPWLDCRLPQKSGTRALTCPRFLHA